MTGRCQELSVLEAEVSLTEDMWEKHPIVTGPEAPCILGTDCLRTGYFKDPKGNQWTFGVATMNTEKIKQLSTLPGLSEDPFVVPGLKAVACLLQPLSSYSMPHQHWSPAKLKTSGDYSTTEGAKIECCCCPSAFLGSPFTVPLTLGLCASPATKHEGHSQRR